MGERSAGGSVRPVLTGVLTFFSRGGTVECLDPMLPDLPIRAGGRTHAMTGFPPDRREDGSMGVSHVISDIVDASFPFTNCRGDERSIRLVCNHRAPAVIVSSFPENKKPNALPGLRHASPRTGSARLRRLGAAAIQAQERFTKPEPGL